MGLTFTTLDVFTDRAFSGNPLAVVDAVNETDLTTERMQAIASEFNLSETVFVMPPHVPSHRARIRIFTPAHELPFAGHPTVGTAVRLALQDAAAGDNPAGAVDRLLVLEEEVGPVRCAVHLAPTAEGAANSNVRDTGFARFDLPQLPSAVDDGCALEAAAIAACLNLSPDDIGFDEHVIARFHAGVPYTTIPVRDLDALGRAKVRMDGWREAFGPERAGDPYLYTRSGNGAAEFRARMFSPDGGIPEDPATGSAAATFAGAIMRFEDPADGHHQIEIRQGVEMGRPSRIQLELEVEDGVLHAARIGGHAVVVSTGELLV